MRRLRIAAVVGCILVTSCAGLGRPRDPKLPSSGCVVSCPSGFLLRLQHICAGGRRWFRDVKVYARHTTRGIDGTVVNDVFITDEGDFDVRDVELKPCRWMIKDDCSAARDRCGSHPGESLPWQPPPTQ